MKIKVILSIFCCAVWFVIFAYNCKKNDNDSNIVTDVCGNIYHTVNIGTQVWMVENLKVTKFNDGTEIPNITNSNSWSIMNTPAYCTYNNTIDPDSINTYGRLYNWFAVNTGKLCPSGWHIPNKEEWISMENYLIAKGYNYDDTNTGNNETNNKIGKSLASITGWKTSLGKGNIGNIDYPAKRNLTGFNAFPGGLRFGTLELNGTFMWRGTSGNWWSSSEGSLTYFAYYFTMSFDCSNAGIGDFYKVTGHSVRCLKD